MSAMENDRILYLEEIHVENDTTKQLGVTLQVDSHDIRMERDKQSLIWKLLHNHNLTSASKIAVIIKAKRRIIDGSSFRTRQARVDVSGLEMIEAFWESRTPAIATTFDNLPATVNFKLRPSPTLEIAYEYIIKAQEILTTYRPLMQGPTEQGTNKPIKYGVTLAEVNPMVKTAFSLVKVTFDMSKEQNKYDESVYDLATSIERILPFADRILEDELCDEAEKVEPVIKTLCSLVMETATFICDHVKNSIIDGLLESPTLLKDRETIRDLWIRFKKLEEDLDGSVSAIALNLRAINNIEKNLLKERLEPIDSASYQDHLGCMEGTRAQVINDIVLWATKPSSQVLLPNNSDFDGMLWVYGMPGIGKSAIAHSVCHRLRESKQLGGDFFCRRDDPARSETRLVPPTLMYGLAGVFGPYRKQMAQALRNDPQLTPQSASGELFLHVLQSLEVYPLLPLVLVVDALDECGEPVTRRRLLDHLLKACRQQKWLKTIVISRPEHDIQSFFDVNGVISRDLGQADHSRADIQHFTKVRMKMVAEKRRVSQHPEPWVGERQLGHIVNRSGGLFLFVETLSQYLMKYPKPKPHLDRLLRGPSEEASIELHKLYLAAIESRVDSEEAESRLVARAVIGVAPHRALCDQAIAAFTGLELGIVSSWVDDLSSLLYRDSTLQGGIRARHISILEYFTGSFCPLDFRVDLKQADTELGTYCLQTMITKLRFNMCKLETSYRANSEIEDLDKRVQKNIPDILQYSCLYWSNHLCSSFNPESMESKEICEYLDMFLRGERVLYWLEVLSVMGKVPAAIGALRKIITYRRKFEEETVALVEDALRFVLAFSTPISTSAPHIYLSALPFAPSESGLWRMACKSFPKVMRVSEGRMTKWAKAATVWKGHTSRINSIAYSPDGLNIVSGSSDKTVRIWDAATGMQIGEPLRGHTSTVASVAYSPDGRSIASGSLDHTIRIWDAATGEPINDPLKGHTGGVESVAYSPDGRKIVSGSEDRTIRIWDAATGTPTGEPLTGHLQFVVSVAYSPDGLNIVSGGEEIRIWDAETGESAGEPLVGHIKGVTSVAYSLDGRNIVSSSWDSTIRIWDATTRIPVGEPLKGHTKGIASFAYSPDGRNIVSGSYDQTIRIWDAETGEPIGDPLKGHKNAVRTVAYSPDSQSIVSGSYDNTIRTWGAAAGKSFAETFTGHANMVTSIAYSPDGLNIASGSWDATIQMWDPETGVPVREPLRGGSKVEGVAYSPDGRKIASSHADNVIRIWDVATGAPIGEPLKGHLDHITGIVYSPNNRYIVSCSYDRTIRIWDAATGMPVGEPLKGHTHMVTSVACSPSNQKIVSGTFQGTTQIWNLATGVPLNEPLKGHDTRVESVAYSPDGRSFVSGSYDNTIRIWDAETGMPVGEPLKGHTSAVMSVAWSPDGQNIISGSYDHTIRIWNPATGALVGDPLRGHLSGITSVIYSPDSRYIVSGSRDCTIRVWDAQQIPSSDRTAFSGLSDLPPQILDKGFFNSSDPNAASRIGLHPEAMDSEGWVRGDDGALLWIPEDCRYGVTIHAMRTIPPEPKQRYVRLDLSNFKFGNSWTDVYHGT